MRVVIDDKFLVDIDERNYVLKEVIHTKQEDGTYRESERVEGYFGDMGRALTRIIHIGLERSEDVTDLKGFMKEYRVLAEYVNDKTNSAKAFERKKRK